MAPEAAEEWTPYELLGGDQGVRQLVADFYELMDTLPEVAPIRAPSADEGTLDGVIWAHGRDVPQQRLT